MKKKTLGMLLALCMAGSLLAGCGDGAQTNGGGENSPAQDQGEQKPGDEQKPADGQESTDGQEPADGGAAAGGAAYTIAANTWGAGAYPLDDIVRNDQYLCDQLGMTLDVANNEFTADKVVSQLESQLANNPDAVLFLGMAETTFVPVVQAIDNKGIPYAFDSNFPGEELMAKCLVDPLCCGGISANPYNMGKAIAELAVADGHKTAVITAAAQGDYSHDNRILGFTETFEAAGGKVVQVSHSADPSEAVAKTNDLLTANPDVDCVYATGGDYLSAAVSIKEQRSDLKCALYGTDVDPSLIPAIQSGSVSAMNGGQGVCGVLSLTLLINYLDGHQILDADGKAPFFGNLEPFVITAENADGFQKMYDAGENFVGMDNFNKLLFRSNPDVTIDTYNEVLEGYAEDVYQRLP